MNQPAQFAYWDTIHEFSTFEIGWLWCALEPPTPNRWPPIPNSPPPPPIPAMGSRIMEAIRTADPPLPACPYWRNGYAVYSRAALRSWAESYSAHRPRFLFPPTSTTDLNLETALKVIAALAHTVDRRWQPGQPRAPHGLTPKLLKSADLLGLQLDRNLISKYLKAAENKNNFA